MIDTIKPDGPFILMTFDGNDILYDERGIVMMNGKPKLVGVERLYFESDLGEHKAKYWTKDINNAHTFSTIDEATTQLCKLKNPQLIKVRGLGGMVVREAQSIPALGSVEVNDAAWKLHDTLTEHGPLNGHQFNNLKGCFYEALKTCLKVEGE